MVSKATIDNQKKKKVTVRVKGRKNHKRLYYIDIEGIGRRVCFIDIGGVGIKTPARKKLDELVATLDPEGLGIRLKNEKVIKERIRRAKAKHAVEKERRARHRRK